MDYSKTIIYKIQHNTNSELVYVGHTTDYTQRKTQHKANVKSHPKKLYQTIRENGGWECFTMVPIMEFPCETKIQAEIQEEKCRVELKATLNHRKAHTTIEEEKERAKKYKEEHREHANEVNKIWYQNHKEERKAYRESIAEEQKEYKKEWYANNKEKINADRMQTYTCSCGKDSLICNRVRHEKTKFHMENKK
jgi:hypothetical protein